MDEAATHFGRIDIAIAAAGIEAWKLDRVTGPPAAAGCQPSGMP